MSSQFLQDKLNGMWREMRDDFREPARKGSKKERESQARQGVLRRARAGWSALAGWVELSDEDIRSHPSATAMLDAGLALIEDPEIMKMALPMLADMAIGRDKPAAWDALAARGFDGRASRDMLLARGYGSHRMDPRADDSMSWLAKAVDRRSWRCAARLAELPAGKHGVPGVDELTAAEEARARDISMFLARMDEEDEAARDWEVDWWRAAHPLLLGWKSHAEEAEGVRRCPQSVFDALRENGTGESWGARAFETAAAMVAMEGSVPAAMACAERGIDPGLALRADMRAPELALTGGVGTGGEQDELGWKAVAGWMDGREPGSSNRLIHKAAMEGLAEQSEDEWKARFCDAEMVVQCLKALGRMGPLGADPAADLAKLQDWGIEIAEREASRGPDSAVARKLRKELNAAMKAWDQKLAPDRCGARGPRL